MWVPIVISLMALIFTVGSFWWLHARRGRLEVAWPRSYAFVATHLVRLRLPLAFYNSGARARVVADLRIVFPDDPERLPLRWITTRTVLRPGSDDGFAFGTPFAVQGRATRELVAEFGEDPVSWLPEPLSVSRLRIEAQFHDNNDNWSELVTFDWWSPPTAELMRSYITHRNEFVGGP